MTRSTMINRIFIIVFLIWFDLASAYSPENHAIITQLAINYLNNKYGECFISEQESRALIKGNIREDKSLIKFPIRPFNQHFYNPLKMKILRPRGASIDARFERIAKRCLQKKNSKRFFFKVGEILHHIQDVTNPAHVVPVYHGPGRKDSFDNQELLSYQPIHHINDTVKSYKPPYLNSILMPIAVLTLNQIKTKFDVDVEINGETSQRSIDWGYFWKDNPNSWFGTYGYLGAPAKHNSRYMDNYLKCLIIKDGATYYIDKSIYDDLSLKQLQLAVSKTAEFILYAKKQAGSIVP